MVVYYEGRDDPGDDRVLKANLLKVKGELLLIVVAKVVQQVTGTGNEDARRDGMLSNSPMLGVDRPCRHTRPTERGVSVA